MEKQYRNWSLKLKNFTGILRGPTEPELNDKSLILLFYQKSIENKNFLSEK